MKTKLVYLLAAALMLGTAGGVLAANGKPTKPKKPTKVVKVVKKTPPATGFAAEIHSLGITCPQTTVTLGGSFGGSGDGFLALGVKHATGKATTLVGKQVSLRMLKSTKVLRHGPTTASKLKNGEKLNIVASMCSQGLVARTITAGQS
jgi:hypothetical protein